jgi:hypothetical protein
LTFTRLVNTPLENKKTETIKNGIAESNVAVLEFEQEIDKEVDSEKNTAELLKQAEFVIDENAFQDFLDSVVEISEGWSVDELCHLRAQLFFSVHNHRMDWDKADLLQVRDIKLSVTTSLPFLILIFLFQDLCQTLQQFSSARSA